LNAPLLPGATIGVLGGGQLGRMLALAARRMGYRIVVLDPSPRCPTAQVADGVVVGALDNLDAAKHLAAQVDVITLDTEHVPADILDALDALVPVRPGPHVLRTIQDRMTQKQFLDRLGVPQTPWREVSTVDDIEPAVIALGGSAIVKVRRAGYDGKGQVRISPSDDARQKLFTLRGEPAVAEQIVQFVREVSVILARGLDGGIEIFPVAENQHNKHVLHMTKAPAAMDDAQRRQVCDIAVSIAEELGHVGVLAVEMFELADQRILVNEIAPRTHNSGHFTYGACATSQFEQHVRAVCGVTLGSGRSLCGAVMVNLLGDLWAKGPPAWNQVFNVPNARLHLYGKDGAAPGRKMGHVVVLDDDMERAIADAQRIFDGLTPSSR
jgi:5-(carboxyamino)imidazole ribonucleotide synthase